MQRSEDNRTSFFFVALCVSLATTPSLLNLGRLGGLQVSLVSIALMNIFVLVLMAAKYYKIIIHSAVVGLVRPSVNTLLFWLIISYSLLTFIALWRAPYESGIYPKYVLMPTLILYLAVILTFTSIRPSTERVFACIHSVVLSAPIFAVLNLLADFYFGNIPEFLSSLLSADRVTSTAFFSGANSSAILHGFSLVCATCLLSRRFSYFCLLSALISSFYLLLSQSKGMIAISVLCIACLFIKPVLIKALAVMSILVWPISSLLLLNFYRLLPNSWLGDLLSRSEGMEYGVATGRPIIWESAWYVLERQPDLFWKGIGFASASRTEAVLPLGFLFNSNSAEDLTARTQGLHNAALQINFDMGLVGLVVHFILLCALMLAIFRTKSNWAFPIFIYIVLTGFNEAVGTYYQSMIYIPFLGILTLFLRMNDAHAVDTKKSVKKSNRKYHKRFNGQNA